MVFTQDLPKDIEFWVRKVRTQAISYTLALLLLLRPLPLLMLPMLVTYLYYHLMTRAAYKCKRQAQVFHQLDRLPPHDASQKIEHGGDSSNMLATHTHTHIYIYNIRTSRYI